MTTNQIKYLEYLENMRANRAKELENTRSNVAKEVETNRANLASEQLTREKQAYDKYGSGLASSIARTVKGATEDMGKVDLSTGPAQMIGQIQSPFIEQLNKGTAAKTSSGYTISYNKPADAQGKKVKYRQGVYWYE